MPNWTFTVEVEAMSEATALRAQAAVAGVMREFSMHSTAGVRIGDPQKSDPAKERDDAACIAHYGALDGLKAGEFWETIERRDEGDTCRRRVAGGWLYRSREWGRAAQTATVALQFVAAQIGER